MKKKLLNKFSILILGYSSLAQRRIIKTLIKNKIKFSIASKSSSKKEKKTYKWFRDYNMALNSSKANIVYISLPNSLHYYWAKKSLEKGYHVIVDKPLTENSKQANNLIKIAKRNNKMLTEAIFFNYHEQFNEAIKNIGGIKNIKHVNANFAIPLPKQNSIRMSNKLSGGCFMDMGPYAAGIARIFCTGKLIRLDKVLVRSKNGLIISFAIICKFTKTTFSGFFCFGGEYQNNLILSSNKRYVELNRVFSSPSDENMKLIIKRKNKFYYKKIKKDNIFENYLKKILESINKKKYSFYYKTILQDINFREKINKKIF